MTGIALILLGPVLLGLVSVPLVNQRPFSPTPVPFSPTPVPFSPFPTPPPTPTPLPASPVMWVCTRIDNGYLNVRQGPGIDYPVIAWLAEGTLVRPTGRVVAASGGVWREIEWPAGWVNSRYLCGGEHE